jgi:hypothetical protein
MWTAENRARYDRSHLRYPSDLSDEKWALIEPRIPAAKLRALPRGLLGPQVARRRIVW